MRPLLRLRPDLLHQLLPGQLLPFEVEALTSQVVRVGPGHLERLALHDRLRQGHRITLPQLVEQRVGALLARLLGLLRLHLLAELPPQIVDGLDRGGETARPVIVHVRQLALQHFLDLDLVAALPLDVLVRLGALEIRLLARRQAGQVVREFWPRALVAEFEVDVVGRRTALVLILIVFGGRFRNVAGQRGAVDPASHTVAASRGPLDRHPGRALEPNLLQELVDLGLTGFRLGLGQFEAPAVADLDLWLDVDGHGKAQRLARGGLYRRHAGRQHGLHAVLFARLLPVLRRQTFRDVLADRTREPLPHQVEWSLPLAKSVDARAATVVPGDPEVLGVHFGGGHLDLELLAAYADFSSADNHTHADRGFRSVRLRERGVAGDGRRS